MDTPAYRPKPPRGRRKQSFKWLRMVMLETGLCSMQVASLVGYEMITSWNAVTLTFSGYMTTWTAMYAVPFTISLVIGVAAFGVAALPILGNLALNRRAGRPLDFVRSVQRECEENDYNYITAAADLFAMRQSQYNRVRSNGIFQHGKTYFDTNWVLLSVKMVREPFRRCSGGFVERLQRIVRRNDNVVNAYFEAASNDMSSTLKRNVRRGLSRPFAAGGDAAEEEARFLDEIATRGQRLHEVTNDCVAVCVSYRHQPNVNDRGMSRDDWRRVYRDVSQFAMNIGAPRFQLWVDKHAAHDNYDWVQVGLMPYLIFPVYRAQVSGMQDSRLWLRLEQLCGTLGAGIITADTSENDYLTKLATTRTPLEATLSVAEVLQSPHIRDLKVSFPRDYDALREWARGVVSTDEIAAVLDTPSRDLGWENNLSRKDLSHLVLFDNDLNDVPLAQGYRRHLLATGPWNAAMALSCGEVSQEAAKSAREIMKSALVLQVAEQNACALYYVIVPTVSGTVTMSVWVERCDDAKMTGNVSCILYDEVVDDELVVNLLSGEKKCKRGKDVRWT